MGQYVKERIALALLPLSIRFTLLKASIRPIIQDIKINNSTFLRIRRVIDVYNSNTVLRIGVKTALISSLSTCYFLSGIIYRSSIKI